MVKSSIHDVMRDDVWRWHWSLLDVDCGNIIRTNVIY